MSYTPIFNTQQIMKHHYLSLLLTLLLSTVGAKAADYDIKVDGLYYNLSGTLATLARCPNTYEGALEIPAFISDEKGNMYYVNRIAKDAFTSCNLLTSVTIPASITTLEEGLFLSCYRLATVTLPEGLTRIGDETFRGCSALLSIDIPNTVTYIGTSAFRGCTSLKAVVIPSSVRSICQGAFQKCYNLEGFFCLASSIYEVQADVFKDVPIDKVDLYVPASALSTYQNSTPWNSFGSIQALNTNVSVSDIAFRPDVATRTAQVIAKEPKYSGRVEIPASIDISGLTLKVTSITQSAFNGCTGLTDIYIPPTVTSISNYAFRGCSGLTFVTIPGSVTSIGNRAFYNCTSLIQTFLYDGLTSIGKDAFSGCSSLTSVTIPGNVTTIENSAFSGCSSLTDVTIPGNVTTIGQRIFGV